MQKKTVLIVDDSLTIASRIKQMLEDSEQIGDVSIAGTFKEGFEILKAASPDIIILDIHLPDRAGIELIPLIKLHNAQACIIMATNQADDFYKSLCLKTGADFFIDKSNEFDYIPQIVASVL